MEAHHKSKTNGHTSQPHLTKNFQHLYHPAQTVPLESNIRKNLFEHTTPYWVPFFRTQIRNERPIETNLVSTEIISKTHKPNIPHPENINNRERQSTQQQEYIQPTPYFTEDMKLGKSASDYQHSQL